MPLFQIGIKEFGNDIQHFLLVPVNAAMGSAFYQVPFGRNVVFLEGLEKGGQFGWEKTTVSAVPCMRSMGALVLENIGYGIGLGGAFRIGQDAAVFPTERRESRLPRALLWRRRICGLL